MLNVSLIYKLLKVPLFVPDHIASLWLTKVLLCACHKCLCPCHKCLFLWLRKVPPFVPDKSASYNLPVPNEIIIFWKLIHTGINTHENVFKTSTMFDFVTMSTVFFSDVYWCRFYTCH